MNRTILAVVSVILILIGAATVYLLGSDKESVGTTNSSQTTQTSQSPPSNNTENVDAAGNGRYIEYSSDIVAKTSGTKVLFFHAPWCPQCRQLEDEILSKGLPAGVTVIKVDYDSNQSLRQKYGVTIQTSFVKVDDNGDLIKKFVAYDEPTVDSIKENIL